MNLIYPDWPAPGNVKAFSTQRTGGFSDFPYGDIEGRNGLNLAMHVGDDPEIVHRNRALLRQYLPSEPVWLNQVHGAEVVNAETVVGVPNADASLTSKQDKVCTIMTADCLPVLFCTVDGKVVGAAHGGWRGLAAGILQHTVQAIRIKSDAAIMAWLGPAIGPKAFEVGNDVRQAFAFNESIKSQLFVPKKGEAGKFMANIYGIARVILRDVGINAVYGGNFCTVTDANYFYSFRRDKGQTGRMATGIWLTSKS